MAFQSKRRIVGNFVKEQCLKAVDGKVILTDQEKRELIKRYELHLEPHKWLLRLFLSGYEGRDDGFYEELGNTNLDKEKFFEVTAGLRDALLRQSGSSRALKSSMLGKCPPSAAVGKAAKHIQTLRDAGILPFKTGLTSGEDYNVLQQAVQQLRSWVACDHRTREAYAEQQEKTSQAEEAAKKAANEVKPEDAKSLERHERVLTKLRKQERRLERMKSHAQFSLDEMDCTGYSLCMGANYLKDYCLEKEGRGLRLTLKNSTMAGSYYVSVGDGQHAGMKNPGTPAGGSPEKGRRRNILFDFTVEKCGDNYLFRYDENGKRPRAGVVKEPRFCWRRKGNSVELYLAMPINIENSMRNIFVGKQKSGKHSAFTRQWPKEVEGLDELRDAVVLGVDIGINRAAFCAALKTSRFENGLPADVQVMDTTCDALTEKGQEYRQLRKDATCLAWLIRTTRRFKADPGNKHNQIKEKDVERFDSADGAYRRYMDAIAEMPSDPLQVWEAARITGYGEWAKEIFARFNHYKHEHACCAVSLSLSDRLVWCRLIDRILSLKKCLHFGGYESKHRKGFCKSLYRLRHNARNDVRKKLARFIVDAAVDAGASVIAMEKLPSSGGKQSKDDNRIWDLMAPNTLATTVCLMAKVEGIGFVQVDPEFTSQWVFEQRVIGDREGRIVSCLDAEGVRRDYDADENAAKNIAWLALTREAEPFCMAFEKRNGVVEPKGLRFDIPEEPTREQDESDQDFKKRLEERDKLIERLQAKADRMQAIVQRLFGDRRPWDAFADRIPEGKSKRLFRHRDGLVLNKPFKGLCGSENSGQKASARNSR